MSQSSITVLDSAEHMAQLPRTAALDITFHATTIRSVGDLSSATNTRAIHLVNVVGLDLANAVFPSSLLEFSISGSRQEKLPKGLLYSRLQALNADSNRLTQVADLDLRGASTVRFDLNPITVLSNVSFSSKLEKLNLGGLHLTTFLVDPESYDALQDRVTDVGSIDVSNCVFPNAVRILQTKTRSVSVCVTPDSMLSSRPQSLPTTPMTSTAAVATSSGSEAPVLVGAVVGVLLLLVLVVTCVRRQRRSRVMKEASNFDELATATSGSVSSLQLNFDDLELLRLDDQVLVKSSFVAEGAFGQVWRGQYRDDPVAIKTLLPGRASRDAIVSLVSEIQLAAKMDSPFIVRLRGAAWRIPSELQMVSEWMDRGDLKVVLETSLLPWEDKVACMLSIAEGLVYLHSMEVIHRDLKSRNVLLDSVKGTKLADFGASREMTTETMTNGVGTYRWMAPEILRDTHYTSAADVYSFGVVLSELATHRTPYYDVCNDQGYPLAETAIISRVAQGVLQPTIPPELCPHWVRELALACLSMAPEDRPSAIQVAHCIDTHASYDR
ncbi:TKL protein kinase, variant 2 [Saprolegnia diclina VS20]|nr:TKL protein kinase, variant 2 [Saprolegnia diclina VS20]EQC30936.1 TKL protein kinase, variant 2 [Saprolegnia diclina VS20]|eukprot:XP_008615674.1 TKL protein kinase, variant 2 [Saprolegnia diclina VS20]